MTDLFRTVLNMSITGAYIAIAIIILRLFMKKLPKNYSYMLWIILGIRLICPFSFSSAVSIFNVLMPEKPAVETGQMEYIPSDIELAEKPAVTVSIPAVNDAVNTYLPPAEPANSVNPMQIILLIASFIWAVGMAVMVIGSVISWLSVKKRVRGAEEKDGYLVSGSIETPFVFGIIKPKIYLPDGISDEDKRYILAHEQIHILRRDHIVKLVSMAALSVHWFNPMVWISYRLMTKDMELSCDEKALGSFEENVKKAYANALLNISAKQNRLTLGGVLSFGESDIKSRIKGVLGAKKPKVIVTVIAVIAVITAAVCLLTNAENNKDYPPLEDGVYVTEKLLYNSPFRDLYPSDDNGNIYEIKDGIMKVSGSYYLDGYAEFSVSEPMEIPFTDKEWSEKYGIVDGIGWQDGEVRLSDYKNKYCYATRFIPNDESNMFYTANDETDSYLFVMDGELWLVDRMEIFRLKALDKDPMTAARNYLNDKGIHDNSITDLRVQQNSFMNEAWKYTLPSLRYEYGVNDTDELTEVMAEYYDSGALTTSYIIVKSNSSGFHFVDEVKYHVTQVNAVIIDEKGNEPITGYEWQEYMIKPDNDSGVFRAGEPVIVFSKPLMGDKRFDVGSSVRIELDNTYQPEMNMDVPYWFVRMYGASDEDIPEDVPDDEIIEEETASELVISEQTAKIKRSRQMPVSVPTEDGFAVDTSYPAVTIEQYIQLGWLADGSGEDGIFTVDGTVVMENTIVYPDSYELSSEEINEKIVRLSDDGKNYVHIIHSGGYYAVYVFPQNEYFSEYTADMIVKSTSITAVSADNDLS